MQTRRASIKETGEELSQAEWDRFDAATDAVRSERVDIAGSDKRPRRDRPIQPAGPEPASTPRSR